MHYQQTNKRLEAQRRAGRFRERCTVEQRHGIDVCIDKRSLISMSHYDYLGLATHPKVIHAFKQGVEKYGVGSSSSHLISGYSTAHKDFEAAFADFLHRDKALLLNSGYTANLAVMTTLADRHTAVFSDKLNHASIVDAITLSRAKHYRYPHDDIKNLTLQLERSQHDHKLMVTESVFSMGGNMAQLHALVKCAKQHKATLIVDDAHGVGVLGQQGEGACAELKLSQTDVPVLLSPLGKAFGCMGAVVSGSHDLIEALVQFARPYIYTTALPPALACAASAALTIVKHETWRREKLKDIIAHFKTQATARHLPLYPADTPIQSIIIGDNRDVLTLKNALLDDGFHVSAIRPPTVPNNTARLRVSLSCLHDKKHIDTFLDQVAQHYEALHKN